MYASLVTLATGNSDHNSLQTFHTHERLPNETFSKETWGFVQRKESKATTTIMRQDCSFQMIRWFPSLQSLARLPVDHQNHWSHWPHHCIHRLALRKTVQLSNPMRRSFFISGSTNLPSDVLDADLFSHFLIIVKPLPFLQVNPGELG